MFCGRTRDVALGTYKDRQNTLIHQIVRIHSSILSHPSFCHHIFMRLPCACLPPSPFTNILHESSTSVTEVYPLARTFAILVA